jgi:hypothetical protein
MKAKGKPQDWKREEAKEEMVEREGKEEAPAEKQLPRHKNWRPSSVSEREEGSVRLHLAPGFLVYPPEGLGSLLAIF